jgi:hypothetical protein
MKNNKKPQSKTPKNDLPDSKDDIKHLQPDEGTLDLPDVEDIPGQEHVRPLPAGEMADTTISSADEEGEGLFDDEEDTDSDSDVTPIEKELLQESSESMASPDDIKLRDARVDNTDEDGVLLNERVNVSGKDLDVPGSEDDDSNEEIGEEDEENNSYSLQDEKEDQNNGRD